jgi:hypothetical protein
VRSALRVLHQWGAPLRERTLLALGGKKPGFLMFRLFLPAYLDCAGLINHQAIFDVNRAASLGSNIRFQASRLVSRDF